ncbi:MAG: shikimate kinase [Planctomycetota bacterium]
MPATLGLMGLRGSGKSTIGPTVAIRLGLPFKDLDPLVLAWNGVRTVREVVDTRGWPAFRDMEHAALERVLGGETCVLALGGGTPTHKPCQKLMATYQSTRALKLIYLRAQPETLVPRISPSDNRPSLTGTDPLKEFDRIFAERDPLYSRLADEVVGCDALSIDEQVDAVIETAKR